MKYRPEDGWEAGRQGRAVQQKFLAGVMFFVGVALLLLALTIANSWQHVSATLLSAGR